MTAQSGYFYFKVLVNLDKAKKPMVNKLVELIFKTYSYPELTKIQPN